jgi:glycosyltransferase involved in cell wall biosynthesis
MVKVAVITRTKDRPLFLKRAIRSVANQAYRDYVHVIVNDGGNPGKVEALVDGVDADIRDKIKVFHRSQSSNAPDTIFNESIDRIDSDYVAIHDDDDTWSPDFLRLAVEMLDDGSQGVVVRTDKVIEKVSGKRISLIKKTQYMHDMKAVSLYRQCIDNQLTPIAFIYRRSAYEEVGKYDSSLPVVGDWEFGIRFLKRFDVEYLDPGYALANYHHRKESDNSFASHNHRKYINKVYNTYLRKDLDGGTMGLGYIMNDLRYQQDLIASTVKRILPAFAAKIIRNKVR